MTDLTGQVVIVTGASSGLGEQLARVGHVAGDREHAGHLPLQPREPLRPSCRQHGGGAGGRQRAAHLLAEPGAGAGDDDHLSAKIAHLKSVQF